MKKNIVVTGGSRGIGLGIAIRLAKAGYRPIIVARTVPKPAIIEAARDNAAADELSWGDIEFDLSNTDSYLKLARRIRDEFGPVYGLVNNAGISLSGILSNTPDASIEHIIKMNVTAPILLTKYLVRSMMVGGGGGRIVNISSIVASTGYAGLPVYSATKASLIGFTKSMAREVGSLGITVNAVAPGFIDTEMTHGLTEKHREQIKRRSALQRMATIDDVAAAVEFLMSTAAAALTGTVMTVDAGTTA